MPPAGISLLQTIADLYPFCPFIQSCNPLENLAQANQFVFDPLIQSNTIDPAESAMSQAAVILVRYRKLKPPPQQGSSSIISVKKIDLETKCVRVIFFNSLVFRHGLTAS